MKDEVKEYFVIETDGSFVANNVIANLKFLATAFGIAGAHEFEFDDAEKAVEILKKHEKYKNRSYKILKVVEKITFEVVKEVA